MTEEYKGWTIEGRLNHFYAFKKRKHLEHEYLYYRNLKYYVDDAYGWKEYDYESTLESTKKRIDGWIEQEEKIKVDLTPRGLWQIECSGYRKQWYVWRTYGNTHEYLCYEDGKYEAREGCGDGWYKTADEAKQAIEGLFNQTCGQSYSNLVKRSPFINRMEKEAKDAIEKHGQFASFHEGYGVIMEEVDEFWDEVKVKEEKRDFIKIQDELIQIAAMCMKLYDLAEEKQKIKEEEASKLLNQSIHNCRTGV